MDGPIQFDITSPAEHYIDLQECYLRLCIRLKDKDGVDVNADTGNVALVNNMMHSLFREVRISLGHNQAEITPSMGTYPYRAYLENLLSFGNNAKGSFLKCEGWYADSPGKMDHHFADGEQHRNTGLMFRKNVLVPSREVELVGRLHCDLFLQERYLLDQVPLKIDLIKNTENFYLMCPDDKEYHLTITKAEFYTRQLTLRSDIREEHVRALTMQKTVKYPLTQVQVSVHDIPQGRKDFHLDHLIKGNLPKRLVLGMVSNEAYAGSKVKNPYNFHHYHVNKFKVKVDNNEVQEDQLNSHFGLHSAQNKQLYLNLFRNLGQLWEENNPLTMGLSDFTQGFTLWVVDLTPDLSASEGGTHHPRRDGQIGVEIYFDQAVPHSVTLICYAEYDKVLEINHERKALMV